MTLKEAQQELRQSLARIYGVREGGNIAELVMETLTGKDRITRIIHAQETLTDELSDQLLKYKKELLEQRPVQYVLGTAHFAGLDLIVNEQVLIPRPETEELIAWVGQSVTETDHAGNSKTPLKVVDIGTGSGCIALALKKKFPRLSLSAIDISHSALEIARRNAKELNLTVEFIQLDILDTAGWDQLPELDIIVSNPPYIHLSEKEEMALHVLNFEPHQALFVENEDVLVFYRKIAEFAGQKLRDGGLLFFEINSAYAKEMVEMLKNGPFATIELKRDMQGQERMVKCLFKK